MTRIAIMQPTYLPWSGYFGLMQSVDLFIFLDTVQFARRSWQQRNQIKTGNGAQWLTVPVTTKGKRDQSVADVQIDHSANFAAKHRKSIELNYRKAPFFEAFAPEILSLLETPSLGLAELNIGLILHLKKELNISTPVMRSSELNNNLAKADLLASLSQQVGAAQYVSPPGSMGYLDDSTAFEDIGIKVSYFQYEHPEYSQQFGDFFPYMSVIDMLFNAGENSRSLIEAGSAVSP